jgi:hypothetical protein
MTAIISYVGEIIAIMTISVSTHLLSICEEN